MELRLHTGQLLPRGLINAVAAWIQEDLTPGWLESLPETVAELCERWSIELEPVIPETYVTLVLLGHSKQLGPVVIKSSPLADEFRAEVAALKLGASTNVARVYDADLVRCVMVQERIVPGTQLRQIEMSDEDASHVAAETVATFWHDVSDPSELHLLRQWMRGLFNFEPRPDRIDPDLLRHAQTLGETLLSSSSRSCLLHGDFQHHNLLLRGSHDWVIIDPKGVYGDPGFEIAAWMYNPPFVTSRADYRALATRRIAIFSDVWAIDRHILTAWAFVGSMLSACWSAADAAPDEWMLASLRGARELRALLS